MEAMRKTDLQKEIKALRRDLNKLRREFEDTQLTADDIEAMEAGRRDLAEGKAISLEQYMRDRGWK